MVIVFIDYKGNFIFFCCCCYCNLMTQREDKILEYYVELFQYNLQGSKQNKLDPNIFWIIFLCGIRDECIDLINFTVHGDVSQLSCPNI